MATMTPDRVFLSMLNKSGVGRFVPIKEALSQLFPDGAGVKAFLDALIKEDLIEVENDVRNNPIRAMILPKGVTFLQQATGGSSVVHQNYNYIAGDNNSLVNQAYHTQIRPNVAPPRKKKSKLRSNVEMLAWITGIIVSVIVIVQSFLPAMKINAANKDAGGAGVRDSTLAKSTASKTSAVAHHSIRHRPTVNKDTMRTTIKAPVIPAVETFSAQKTADVNDLSFSKAQRHITPDDIRELQEDIAARNTTTLIDICAGSNKECRTYAAEIRKSLDSLGYPVDPHIYDVDGTKPTKRFYVGGVATMTIIRIYPIYQY